MDQKISYLRGSTSAPPSVPGRTILGIDMEPLAGIDRAFCVLFMLGRCGKVRFEVFDNLAFIHPKLSGMSPREYRKALKELDEVVLTMISDYNISEFYVTTDNTKFLNFITKQLRAPGRSVNIPDCGSMYYMTAFNILNR